MRGDEGWTGLMSPCGQDLSVDPDRFTPLDEFEPRPDPVVRPAFDHAVHVYPEHERGDAGNGLWFVAYCPCHWESCRYRSRHAAEVAGRQHQAAAA